MDKRERVVHSVGSEMCNTQEEIMVWPGGFVLFFLARGSDGFLFLFFNWLCIQKF